nr:hypothetical protein [Nocardioides panacis]
MPRARASYASRSSSTDPIPTPCRDSSTSSATSASPPGTSIVVATPTRSPRRSATREWVAVPGSLMPSTKDCAAARLPEKNRL